MLPSPPSSASIGSWKSIAQRAQDHRDETPTAVQPPVLDITNLPQDSTSVPKMILTTDELSITESDPEKLIARMASGELSSVQVTNAFLRRAAIAQKLVNCVTELLPEAALGRAASLDAYLKEHGKPAGPLHGVCLPKSFYVYFAQQNLTTML